MVICAAEQAARIGVAARANHIMHRAAIGVIAIPVKRVTGDMRQGPHEGEARPEAVTRADMGAMQGACFAAVETAPQGCGCSKCSDRPPAVPPPTQSARNAPLAHQCRRRTGAAQRAAVPDLRPPASRLKPPESTCGKVSSGIAHNHRTRPPRLRIFGLWVQGMLKFHAISLSGCAHVKGTLRN